MEKRRKPIRRKVQSMVLLISVAALVITSLVGIMSMVRIQKQSEVALVERTENILSNTAVSKAELADSEFGKYAGYIRNFAEYTHGLYANREEYKKKMVYPADSANEGIYSMQRGLASTNIRLNDVKEELCLLGNLEQAFYPVISDNSDVITTIYIGTESGIIISYDTYANSGIQEGSTETYYDYFDSSWYTQAKEAGEVCFTDVYQDSFGKGLMISCAAPFYGADDEFAGVVCMDIRITDLYDAIVEMNLGDDPEAYAFLVDSQGNVISPEAEAETIYNRKDLDDQVLAYIEEKTAGVSRTESGFYYACAPVKMVSWMLCTRVPESMVLAPVRAMDQEIINSILIFLIVLVGMIVIVTLVVRTFALRLTEPLLALGKDAKEISGGNLEYRAKVYENDEIGDLAGNFNEMAVSLKKYIEDLTHVTAEKERIGAELNVATQIQADMLPSIFPAFPERSEFDIYATMNPAKEVGGDFYDFFLVDDDHLAMVMADVSGKGVPAALFMVIAKTLIKNRALMGDSPAEILHNVNEQLCEGNEAELFVTVWLGILEISTGKGMAANAGHEHPVIRRGDGSYELVVYRHSPAVATMEGLRFREHEFEMHPGDSLFVYTDGVPEATNASDELFGSDRMLAALNKNPKAEPSELLCTVKEEIEQFVGDAPQFDDITMLCLSYIGSGGTEVSELKVDAKTEKLDEVLAFVDGHLEELECPVKTQMQIDIAVEELFVNIAHYAYGEGSGDALIRVETQKDPKSIRITFVDQGTPYDPLKREDPDITLSAEERKIGGLGIFMVKKSMDEVSYEYKDGSNMLTIQKNLQE